MLSIGFGTYVCGQLEEGGLREWLIPDGRGGYAMGTVSGLRTRRYHGLLIVADPTPASRKLGLASLDPLLTLPSGKTVALATHEWTSGIVDPTGHVYLEHFDLTDGLPRWRWRIGEVVLERELAMTHGRPALTVVHRLLAGGPVSLSLRALCTWRDAHAERYASGPAPTVTPVDGGAVIDGAYRLHGPGWVSAGQWWRGVHYRQEAARGLAATEDLWHAGTFTAVLPTPGTILAVRAWAGSRTVLAQSPSPAEVTVHTARTRNRQVVASTKPDDDVEATLMLAADSFVISTDTGPDVVAGYPWFGSWGRDTLISYEGLFLTTGRVELGRRLLQRYGMSVSEGMIANTSDTGAVEYNSVDAGLWFLDAVSRHANATGDADLVIELMPAMRAILESYLRGTRHGIGVDPSDGLVRQGARNLALTWMDARVDGTPVTQRAGKPVEINALWVNGLASVVSLCQRTKTDPGIVVAMLTAAQAGFERRFPITATRGAQTGLLHDVIDGHDSLDSIVRPNQLLAWSLPYAPLRPDAETLTVISNELLTPLGLRTLAPESADYRPFHRGDGRERDLAYHQGTVWPWLLGPFATARHKANLDINNIFRGVECHLSEFGLGSVSEVADGQPPHAASGCPFQAWSVAEILRARRLGHSPRAGNRAVLADAGGVPESVR